MSSPELWVVALLRWLLLCALAGAIGGIAGRALAREQAAPGPAALPGPGALRASLLGLAVTAVLTVLTPPQAPIRSLSYQHRTSQR